MILSSLVNPDPNGFIELDKNLGSHIGANNVDAFHEEAGNLTIREMLSNPTITREITGDGRIMKELNLSVSRIGANAFGLGRAAENNTDVTKAVFHVAGGENVETLRNVMAAELLNNPVVNNATSRNPAIMKELAAAVTKLYESKKAAFKK